MKRLFLIAAGALAACSSPPSTSNYKQEQAPVTPKGTIIGRVMDMSNYGPLEGVAVKAIGATTTTLSTNSDGVFVLNDAVVNSTYLFVLEKTGYLRQRTTSAISGSTGNSPLAGSVTAFNVQMYKGDGEVRGNVFLPDGKPAANAKVAVDNAGRGDSIVTAVTDAAGAFTLTGLAATPAGVSTSVSALWYDENADQLADYGTTAQNITVQSGVIARLFIFYSSIGQRVIASNVFDAELAPSDDLTFGLALPVLNSNLNQAAYRAFVLTNQTRGGDVAVEATWASAVQVAVHPTTPLKEGERYRIALALTNASAGASNSTPNFNASFDFQVRSANISAITDQVQNFSVTNPVISATRGPRAFQWDSTQFNLTWDAVPNAVGYQIYAKDTLYCPNYVRVGSMTSQSLPRYTMAINNNDLGAAFDPNGGNRPLALGNKVTFTVVPMDVYGNISPLNAAPTVQIADNVQPTAGTLTLINPLAGTLDAANDETTPLQIQLRLTYNEPMDATTMPTFTSLAPGVTQTFVWDNFIGSYSGVLTLTVAAAADASGPFTIRGGRDMAGNQLLNNDFNGSLTGRKELGTNWNFEDASGNCSLNGWTGTNTGGMQAPVTVNNSSSRGRCAAVMGPLPGANPATGISRMYQDVTLGPLTNTPNYTYDIRVNARLVYYTTPAGTAVVTQRCGLADNTTNTFLITPINGTNTNQAGYVLGTGAAGALANTTVRVMCELNNTSATIGANTAIYVDELSVALVKPGTIL